MPASRGAAAPDGDRAGRRYAQHPLSGRPLRLGAVGPGDLPCDRCNPHAGAATCASEAEAGRVFYVTFPPVENIVPESGREIEPRTYLQEEDEEPLLHHYVIPEEIDALL